MNYERIYDQLIENKKSIMRKKSKYEFFEKHHIIPKSMGGGEEKENLVLLTPREHFVAHMLIAKIYGGKMWAPVVRMRTKLDGTKMNSSMFEIAKNNASAYTSERNSGKRTIRNKTTGKSEQQLVSESIPEGYESTRVGMKHTQESIDKISKNRTGIIPILSEESFENKIKLISESHKNGRRSNAYSKISNSMKGKVNKQYFYILETPSKKIFLLMGLKEVKDFIKKNDLTKKLILDKFSNFLKFTEEMISNKPCQKWQKDLQYNTIGWSIQKCRRLKI